jgi:beta-lactamase superfamily II metal-dependent hydrolase
MLLGDRSFVDQAKSVDFQKTGVFHVLVVTGLHVGALAYFFYWLGNRLRSPRMLATVLLLAALFAYIAVVEQLSDSGAAGVGDTFLFCVRNSVGSGSAHRRTSRQTDKVDRGGGIVGGFAGDGDASFPCDGGALEVDVLDVAQGDSILVISPKGSTLLIDGGGRFAGFRGREEVPGPDPGEEAVSAYLWPRGIQRLDAVALTHAHQDHIGGLKAVLENFQVGRLWLGRENAEDAEKRKAHSEESLCYGWASSDVKAPDYDEGQQ